MPAAGELKVVFHGKLPGGEVWATGFQIGGASVSTQSDLDNILNNVAAAYVATGSLRPALLAANPTSFTVDGITGYYYSTVGPASFQSEHVLTDVGGSATQGLPHQLCGVVTLRTARSGRSYRGRMYLPVLSKTLVAGQFQSADVDALCNGVKTMFQNINGGTGGYSVAVASSHVNALTHVTSVTMDSKPDIQRRRAAKLSPAYVKSNTGL